MKMLLLEGSMATVGCPAGGLNEAAFTKHLASPRYVSGPSLPAPARIHCPFHKYLQIMHHGPGTVLSRGDSGDQDKSSLGEFILW